MYEQEEMLSVIVQLKNQVRRMIGAIQNLYRIPDEDHDSQVKNAKWQIIGWSAITKEMSENFIHGDAVCTDWIF